MNKTILFASTLILIAAPLAGCATSDDGDDGQNADENVQLAPDAADIQAAADAAKLTPEHTAFNFFVNKGLSKNHSAGIIGNLMQESSMNPGAVEFGGGPGRGIAQWSVGGRYDTDAKDNLVWFANSRHVSRTALTTQLDFVWYELTTFSHYGLAKLRASSGVPNATIVFEDDFEGCGTCDQARRISFAQQALKDFGN